jgi:hypothetical protein
LVYSLPSLCIYAVFKFRATSRKETGRLMPCLCCAQSLGKGAACQIHFHFDLPVWYRVGEVLVVSQAGDARRKVLTRSGRLAEMGLVGVLLYRVIWMHIATEASPGECCSVFSVPPLRRERACQVCLLPASTITEMEVPRILIRRSLSLQCVSLLLVVQAVIDCCAHAETQARRDGRGAPRAVDSGARDGVGSSLASVRCAGYNLVALLG